MDPGPTAGFETISVHAIFLQEAFWLIPMDGYVMRAYKSLNRCRIGFRPHCNQCGRFGGQMTINTGSGVDGSDGGRPFAKVMADIVMAFHTFCGEAGQIIAFPDMDIVAGGAGQRGTFNEALTGGKRLVLFAVNIYVGRA